MGEVMAKAEIIDAIGNLKEIKTPTLEVRKGVSAEFLSIHGGEIRLENYLKEKVKVTLVRRGNVALLVLTTGDGLLKDQYTVNIYEQSTEQGKETWTSRGGIEVSGPPSATKRALARGVGNVKADLVLAYYGFFGTSPRAVAESLDILGFATGRDFSDLKNIGINQVIKSELVAAHRITTFKFRKMLMELIQITIDRKGKFSEVLGDDNQNFAILTGEQLQKSKEFVIYDFVKSLNPTHEYFVTEDTGAKRFTAVDLTLGRATGEVKIIRQADDEPASFMHIDGMDRPVGEIEVYDSIMNYVSYLHMNLFEKRRK